MDEVENVEWPASVRHEGATMDVLLNHHLEVSALEGRMLYITSSSAVQASCFPHDLRQSLELVLNWATSHRIALERDMLQAKA